MYSSMSDTYYLCFLYIRSYRHVSFLNFPCQQRVRYNTILIFSSISIPFAYSYHPFSPLPSASICLYLPPLIPSQRIFSTSLPLHTPHNTAFPTALFFPPGQPFSGQHALQSNVLSVAAALSMHFPFCLTYKKLCPLPVD